VTLTVDPRTAPTTVPSVAPAPPRFRPDVDGLRAIAILLVVGYHAGVPGLHAGFMGVDVFFVISGFLITTVLVEEMDRTGTVELRRFWARRARRLLPAASVVALCTLLAGMVVLSPLDWASLANEGLAATTYWSNVLFGLRADDYFGTSVQSSPFLHTWSLSVEEQFYLVWPLLLLVILRAGRAAGAQGRRFLLLALGLVTVSSLAVSLSLTDQESPWAYFSSASRGWELGAGALLAVAFPLLAGLPSRGRVTLRLAGLGLLVAAVATIDGDTPFPGWAATLPVLATVALVAAGHGTDRVGRALAIRPLQAVGRLSYSWYLWHWPVLVLGAPYAGRGVAARVALALAALVPAALTHRYVENPIRQSKRLAASPAKTLGFAACFLAVAAGAGGLIHVRAAAALRDPRLHALTVARDDRPPLADACASTDLGLLEERCTSGDPAGQATILLIGDSHAAQWQPALDSAARRLGARLVTSVQGNCPSLGVAWSAELPSCGLRRQHLPALVDRMSPQLVVVSHSVGYIGGLVGAPDEGQLDAWTDSLATLASHLRDAGIPLAVLLDTPRLPEDPIHCLSDDPQGSHCGVPLADALRTIGPFHEAEREALRRAGHGSAFDPLVHLCDGAECPAAPGGTVAYVDTHHLTAGFSASMADRLLPFVAAELG
jgi:peptidoglycan/LPS O-acetylase OafA/YrhL